MSFLLRVRPFMVACLAGLLVLSAHQVQAERPSAPKLLPSETVAYLRVNDTQELIEKFQETAGGRLSRDEKIRPLLMHLYGSAADAFSNVQDRVGASLDELLAIPQGEICVAMVAPADRDPGVVVIVDVDEENGQARKLIETLETQVLNDATRRVESVGDTEISIFEGLGNENRTAAYFFREDTFFLSSDVLTLKGMLSVWDGDATDYRALADNRKFTTIIKRSAGTKGERPQVTWFVDPIDIVRKINRNSIAGQATLAMLEPFGLTGLKAVGGSMILGTEEFDSIAHMHVMMSAPRRGVLEMVAIKSADTAPEPWVPNDVAAYMTLNWDTDRTVKALTKLYDRVRNEEGALELDATDFFNRTLGINYQEDVLDQVEGRVTYLSWVEKPARVNSQSQMIGLKLKDAEAFEDVLEKVVAKYPERLLEDKIGKAKYYHTPEGGGRIDEELIRRPTPCVMIVGDYLLATDSVNLLKHVVKTKKSGNDLLVDDLEFKLINSKLKSQPGGAKPGMIVFQRPEEGMRALYDMATADNIRDRLDQGAENNDFFRAINEALKENPLPPFSDIAKYLAPSGGLITSDETGIHYIGFALKRE